MAINAEYDGPLTAAASIDGCNTMPLRAAGTPPLNGRAFGIAVRTIHTAIAFKGFKQHTTALAFIEELTCVGRHQLSL